MTSRLGRFSASSNLAAKPRTFYPEYEDLGEGKELIADVGYLARLRNPFKINRTLTICNGIHSRGVFGAVRCLTDARCGKENEKYSPTGSPMMSSRCCSESRLSTNETLSPDLQNPDARLYEWSPTRMVVSERHQPRIHRSLKKVQQRASHAALSQDVSGVPAPPVRSRPGRLDAIIVPASRPASCLQPAINLAARLGVLLVVLCSKQTRAEQVAERVSTSPGARALVVEIPRELEPPDVSHSNIQPSVQRGERQPRKRLKRETQYRTLAGSLTWLEQDRLRRRRRDALTN